MTDVAPFAESTIEFRPRLNLLTGDNGIGKSFLLELVWHSLSQTWAGFDCWFDPEGAAKPRVVVSGHSAETETDYTKTWAYRFDRQRWVMSGANGSQKSGDSGWSGPVIYLCANGDSKLWDPARDPRGQRAPRSDDDFTYEFTPSTLQDGLKGSQDVVLCDGLIRDWVTWQRSGSEAFKRLTKVLKLLSDRFEPIAIGEPARVSIRDVRDFPILVLPSGPVPFHHASAAIQRIAGLAYLLVWGWEEHVHASKLRRQEPTRRIALLLDEVESHLHPRWQRLILPALLEAIAGLTEERVDVQVFTTTHSPLVLASVEPLFDPELDAIWEFKLSEGTVHLEHFPWQRRGDASAWLTSSVFDLQEARSIEAENALEKARSLLQNHRPQPQEIHEVDQMLRSALSETDRFWIRWSAYRDQLSA